MPRPTQLHQILEQRAARSPGAPCLIDHDGRRFDNAAAWRATDAIAARLAAAGVGAGDRVMVVGENAAAMACALFALSALGAWAVPCNARARPAELARVRAHADPRALLFAVGASAAADRHATALGAGAPLALPAGPLRLRCAPGAAAAPASAEPERRVAALFYTTGTTGAPKGVMLSHANLLSMAALGAEVRGLNPADRLYCVLPISHIYAFASAMLSALYFGAELQLAARFDPAATLAALRDGVTCLPAVPQLYAALMAWAEGAGETRIGAHRLRYIAAGGAPLDPHWQARVERFFGLPLHNGYGMTECSPGIAATRPGAVPRHRGCGPPMPGTEVRIAPAPGQRALCEGVGELRVRGPQLMLGYYRDPAATAAAIDDEGFLRTGDLGRWIDGGCLEIVGRCKELIIRSGFNVYPPEVEAALNSHPAVLQCAVIGRPQADGNEEVLAFVQSDSAPSPEALREWARERLAPYKVPSQVVVAEALPAAPSGKPLKHQLLEALGDRLRDA